MNANNIRDEIEDLHSLADECRAWSSAVKRYADENGKPAHSATEIARSGFDRIATKLDAIAKRLAQEVTA